MDFSIRELPRMIENLESYPRRDGFSSKKNEDSELWGRGGEIHL